MCLQSSNVQVKNVYQCHGNVMGQTIVQTAWMNRNAHPKHAQRTNSDVRTDDASQPDGAVMARMIALMLQMKNQGNVNHETAPVTHSRVVMEVAFPRRGTVMDRRIVRMEETNRIAKRRNAQPPSLLVQMVTVLLRDGAVMETQTAKTNQMNVIVLRRLVHRPSSTVSLTTRVFLVAGSVMGTRIVEMAAMKVTVPRWCPLVLRRISCVRQAKTVSISLGGVMANLIAMMEVTKVDVRTRVALTSSNARTMSVSMGTCIVMVSMTVQIVLMNQVAITLSNRPATSSPILIVSTMARSVSH